ncbi:MAG: hypothetical protein HYV07_12010 [Deltaproteobacteria bacterium]|nr:hypothetical protein [Deltaproteobacteria bacterium]
MKRRLLWLLAAGPIALLVAFLARLDLGILARRAWLQVDPDRVMSEVAKDTNQLLGYGQSPAFYRYETVLARGYGHCGTYSKIVAKKLVELGVESSLVSVETFGAANHTVVEARFEGRRYVVDGNLGVAYRGGVFDLIREPATAVPISGSIPSELSAYGGKALFGQVALIDNSVLEPSFDSTLFQLPAHYVEISLVNKRLFVGWPNGLDVPLVTLTFTKTVRLRSRTWVRDLDFPALAPRGIVPDRPRASIELEVVSGEDLETRDVRAGILATQESGERTLLDYTPLSTFVAFDGGSALIDSVELLTAHKSYLHVDVGTPSDERAPGNQVFAKEYFGTAVNTWGAVVTRSGATYRAFDSAISARSTHAAIEFSPSLNGLDRDSGFFLRVCYLNPADADGETTVKAYDLTKDAYATAGHLTVAEDPRCDQFPVSDSSIRATLGSHARGSPEGR